MNYEVKKAEDNLWIIQESNVRSFLLVGSERALLIDTGCNLTDLKTTVEEITSLPVLTAITHADGDHISCVDQFAPVYMSPSEYAFFHHMGKSTPLLPLWDGDEFDLGDRKVKAIMNPGHTSGCCVFLDTKGRRLIGGDSIQQDGDLYMYGTYRDLLACLHSMERLVAKYGDQIDTIYPAHSACPIPGSTMLEMIAALDRMLSGKVQGQPAESFGTPIRVFDIGVDRVLYEREKSFFEK